MNSRERVVTSLNHKEPDMVPLDIGGGTSTTIVVEGYEKLKKYLNIEEETEFMNKIFRLTKISEAVRKKLESDCYPIGIKPARNWKPIQSEPGTLVDIWGVKWKEVYYAKGSCKYYEMNNNPLRDATIEDLSNYNWPDPYDPGYTQGLTEEIENIYNNTNYALVGDVGFKSFWELGYMLRGFNELLMDLAINKKFVTALMNKLYEINIIVTGRYLDIVGDYIQVFRTADDLASQTGLLFSIDTYRQLLKPFYKKFIEFVKSKTRAKIFYHSCGNVKELFNDFIEIGIDIINPVQVSALGDMVEIKKKYGRNLAFWGGIDTQKILPWGSISEVENEVSKRIKELGSSGGYVIASVHNIQPDVPPENIVAMASAAKKFGMYPINL